MTLHSPGLQRERTAMAWSRTGVAVLVNALIVLRAGTQASQPAIIALGTLLLGASGAAVAAGAWRSRRLAVHHDPTTPWWLVAATVAIAWVACIAAVASIAATVP